MCFRCADVGGPPWGAYMTFACGHTVCRPHLRKIVAESLKAGIRRPPQCCGRSIPRLAIQAVTRADEEAKLFPAPPRPPPPRMSSIPRLPAEVKQYTTERGRTRRMASYTNEHGQTQRPITEEAQRNLRCAMACSNFKALRRMQEDQRSKFLKFRRSQRDDLASYHADLRQSKEEEHAKERRELEEAVCPTLSPILYHV